MRIDEFSRALERTATARGLTYELAGPAPEVAISSLEGRLAAPAPAQVLRFYRHHNGFTVGPSLIEMFPIEALIPSSAGMFPFCRFDGRHQLSFDVRERNAADQWSILNPETGFLVTLTIESFLTNKVFAWLKKSRPIWRSEHGS